MRRARSERPATRAKGQEDTDRSYLPGQTPADERNMDQIVFIIFGHGVQDNIDAEMKGVLALRFAARRTRVCPVAQLVTFPGAAEVVLAINDRRRRADGNPFEIRAGDTHAADAPQKIIASERRMAGGQALEIIAGKNSLQLTAHRLIEAVALLAERIIDEQKTTVAQKAPQCFDFLLGKGVEFIFAG